MYERSSKTEVFLCLEEESLQGVISQQCIVIPKSTSKEKIKDALEYMTHARSYLVLCGLKELCQFPNSRFLRISHTYDILSEEEYSQMFELMNSRYHAFAIYEKFVIPSSINLL